MSIIYYGNVSIIAVWEVLLDRILKMNSLFRE